jgi:hypothetical protein
VSSEGQRTSRTPPDTPDAGIGDLVVPNEPPEGILLRKRSAQITFRGYEPMNIQSLCGNDGFGGCRHDAVARLDTLTSIAANIVSLLQALHLM